MLLAIQRYRSIVSEDFLKESNNTGLGFIGLGFTKEFLAEQWPWIFGEKCPISAIQDVLDREEIAPMDFYNLMAILTHFMPEVKVYGECTFSHEFPVLDMKWMIGFDV
jgi:hypothetical protein